MNTKNNNLPNTVSVIGAGSWGTALAIALAENINTVKLWGNVPEAMEELARTRINEPYEISQVLNDNIEVHVDLDEVINEELCFLVVVPSHAFRPAIMQLCDAIQRAGKSPGDAKIVWGTKGLEPNTLELLSTVANEVFGENSTQAVLSGPSFAKETAAGQPTAFTIASENLDDAKALATWFKSDFTRPYVSDDIIGVQIGGAIKNVMAIAAGISSGLGYGANASAALITRGLAEIIRLGVAMGAKPETFMGLSGIGDLMLTSTDNQSRNRRFGYGIGQGRSKDKVINEINQEIEGITTVKTAFELGQRINIDMPITRQVYEIVHLGKSPKEAEHALLERELTQENQGVSSS